MKLEELGDAELHRIHGVVVNALESGEPLSDDVRKFGIRDFTSLSLWTNRLEREMDKRGMDYRPAPPAPGGDAV